ncbi:MAG: hypothetical protein A2Y12_20845 [Planctomycetes bacterium GWF2_42_9]|nr:MAG: hypothetical protein A2Y12_20845 [Planctomycetes bacterium GWF2_42_9]
MTSEKKSNNVNQLFIGLGIRRHRMLAFTLVELLVVISIIALLLAILMPSLQKARNQGKAVICLNNMKQLGLSVALYENKNDGYVTPGSKTSDGELSKAGPLWYDILRQNKCLDYEGKKAGVLRCPTHVLKTSNSDDIVSYSTNVYVMGITEAGKLGPPWDELWKVRKVTTLRSPGELILMGERGSDYPIGNMYSPIGVRVVYWSGKNPSTPWGFDWSRHSKKITFVNKKKMFGAKANLLLADGHAKSFSSSSDGWDILWGSDIWGGVISDPPPGCPSMSIKSNLR